MSTPADNRFAPPKSHVADVTDTEPKELADRLSRLGAAIIDGLLFFAPFLPFFFQLGLGAMGAMRGANSAQLIAQAMQNGAGKWLMLASVVELAIVVVTIVYIYKYSQTIGKRLVGIKIVRTDGSRASFSRIFWLRGFVNGIISYACRFIPVIGAFYGLVDCLFIFGNARRCIHDYIADTIVVKA